MNEHVRAWKGVFERIRDFMRNAIGFDQRQLSVQFEMELDQRGRPRAPCAHSVQTADFAVSEHDVPNAFLRVDWQLAVHQDLEHLPTDHEGAVQGRERNGDREPGVRVDSLAARAAERVWRPGSRPGRSRNAVHRL